MASNEDSLYRRQSELLVEVSAELMRQFSKWGIQSHNPVEWISVEAEEFGEAAMEANKAYWARTDADRSYHLVAFRQELIQVAAVAIAAIESLDRNELANR